MLVIRIDLVEYLKYSSKPGRPDWRQCSYLERIIHARKLVPEGTTFVSDTDGRTWGSDGENRRNAMWCQPVGGASSTAMHL